MMKKHPNLFIKILLVILMVLLFWLIFGCAEAESAVQSAEAKTVETAPVFCTDVECCTPETEDEYLAKIQKWEEEYYYATNVWKYLRQRGFSQEVTCGIIGNMMIETSGGTLDLKPYIYSPSGNYYGLCQWSQKYYPGTKDLPFEHQLDYLLGSMPWEFNTFGKNYKAGFKYEDFLKMTDPAEAALAFAKSYERCGPASYEMRQEAAIKAYKYFNLEAPLS
jgi:uncharacterized protein YceK